MNAARAALGALALTALAGCALVFMCVLATQSRGGLLVYLAVLGVYLIRKYGIKYAVIGVMLMLPLMNFALCSCGRRTSNQIAPPSTSFLPSS